jgi:hypothetical protein
MEKKDKKEKFESTEKKSNKMGGFNIIVISIISFLYILLITKIAEIISGQLNLETNLDLDLENSTSVTEYRIGVYVMIIYFVSIIGIIIGYIWFNNNNGLNSTPNWIIRWSLSIGGVLMLIYTIINYWEYLNDYSKLLLIFLSIVSIIYYLYKYY